MISLTPLQTLGIPIALLAAVFLALGAHFQHSGVAAGTTSAAQGLRLAQIVTLLRRPVWILGTLMLGIAIVLQLFSLFLAPLTVVQPIGAVALIVTAIVTSRTTKTPLTRRTVTSILCCVTGIGMFVTVAALTTQSVAIGPAQLSIVLVVLAVVVTIVLVVFAVYRRRATAFFSIVAAGILFGFVATLAKVIIDRVHLIVERGFSVEPGDVLAIVCLAGIVVAGLLGSYFVQTAYSSGPADLVVAGLTVVDPLVGVSIGIVVLGEASTAPWWAGVVFVLAGALAVFGVVRLARRDV